MGDGEWYLWMWHRWWESQDAPARAAYQLVWPTPKAWRNLIVEDDDEDEDDEEDE